MPPRLTPEIIVAAIAGFEAQKAKIDLQIAELRAMLDGGSQTEATPEVPIGKRKKFSAAARKRMKEAQQRRWAKVREESEPTAPAAVKRKISTAGRKAIAEAQRKRWAASKKAEQPKAAPAKKKLSPARKAALVANLAKARAARAAKRATA